MTLDSEAWVYDAKRSERILASATNLLQQSYHSVAHSFNFNSIALIMNMHRVIVAKCDWLQSYGLYRDCKLVQMATKTGSLEVSLFLKYFKAWH